MHKTFSIWRFVFSLGVARSGTWSNTTKTGTELTHIFSVQFIKNPKYDDEYPALQLIFLCFYFTVGFVK